MNLCDWTIWTQILFATSLAFSWPVDTLLVQDDLTNGICQRKYVRNFVELESLRDCRVIEGSLQISMLSANSTDVFANISYPKLREITGYFLLFYNYNLTTMRNMFPNLAVIRGQELIDTHALIISHMDEMQEVGLPALTNILRGTVWIVGNPNLCYVDTVDWGKIANETSADGIAKNKPQCPNTCRPDCPTSDFDRRPLCWSNGNCQIVHQHSCPKCNGRPCLGKTGCCHNSCLGGCSGPRPEDCDVCKHVIYENVCADKCPNGYYEYLNRRCVSKDECLRIVSPPEEGEKGQSTLLTGKWYTDDSGKNMCVLECPKNTALVRNGTSCEPCKGICKKLCQGRLVDSVEVARDLAGCTRIIGALKINIRRGAASAAGAIVKELKQNLDKIEEIDDYLAITYTYSIYSLDFLENLKIIRGINLDEDKYALTLKSNENLMELWNPEVTNVIIENTKARVLFHYNSKLCPEKIWNFVKNAGINRPKDDKIDIGITNGDKVTCNKITLRLDIKQETNSSVTVSWENFRRNLTLTSHLLGYEVHYKETIENKTVSKFEDRDACAFDGWNIVEQTKISESEAKYGEPEFENDKLIANLKPFTHYAIYVKAIVIPDEASVNNNTGAESDVRTFRTLADIPTKPRTFLLAAGGPNSATISWEPPISPNGIMDKFRIWIKPIVEDQNLQDQRNYCVNGRSVLQSGSETTVPSFTEAIISQNNNNNNALEISSKKGNDCCSCAAPGTPVDIKQVLYEDDMLDAIMKHVLFKSVSFGNNEDRSSNEVRKTRRRRSTENISASDEVGEDGQPVVIFPHELSGQSLIPGLEESSFSTKGMKLSEEVMFNSSLSKYTHILGKLKHYTMYQVGIQACREQDPNIPGSDTRICSDVEDGFVQTALSPTADNIIPKSVQINITDGNRLHLSWPEPMSPNGVVMAYTVKVTRIGGGTDIPVILKCMTRKDFLSNKRRYTLPELLHPGNYSVSVQVASLAQDSEFTVDQYFHIEDLESSLTGFWALVILLPIMLTILVASLLVLYYIRKKGIIYGRQVFSANPEYMQNVDIPEEWEVARDKVDLLEVIGEGSFGLVYRGILKDFIAGQPRLICAIKTVFDDTPSEDRALFLKEAALMTQLNCYHVVKLLGVTSKTQPIYVIMELMPHGDLKKFLKARRPDEKGHSSGNPPPPTLRQILKIAAEIADGMAYIHSHRLVHRDLAARNCMVAEDMSVKVGDFGMTKEVIQSDYYRKQTRGLLPVRWMAPESLKDGVFTNQSDVWSFGVVLWEMATLAAQPYQGLGHVQVIEYVQAGRVMEKPENCPDLLYELMRQCWDFNEHNRPTFFSILDRLTPDLDSHFAKVSFFNSSDGVEYRAQLQMRPTRDELITIRTPLKATFDLSDDELDDYDSDDDHHRLNHRIIDDLGDTPSRRLMTSSPAPKINPPVTKSLANGLALQPLAISGSNGSGIRNGNPASSFSPVSTMPSSLFSNPPLRTNYTMPNTNSNNNNTTTITSAPNFGFADFNSVPSTKISNPVTSARVNPTSGDGPVNSSTTTYASIVPRVRSSGQVNNISDVNTGGTGLDSNESSKSYSINFSGESHKVGNGGGGNGYITLRHSPVNENQRNRTTQF